jgi:hypothetical protein
MRKIFAYAAVPMAAATMIGGMATAGSAATRAPAVHHATANVTTARGGGGDDGYWNGGGDDGYWNGDWDGGWHGGWHHHWHHRWIHISVNRDAARR